MICPTTSGLVGMGPGGRAQQAAHVVTDALAVVWLDVSEEVFERQQADDPLGPVHDR